MSSYLISRATLGDNKELCSLCTIPLPGKISLSLERSPNFFAGSHIQCEEIETYTCRKKDDQRIMGVFSIGKRRVFYKNEIKWIRYFSDLRIHPAAQGSRIIFEISRYITDHKMLEDDVAQTIVFADNTVMLRLIERLQHHSKKLSIFKYFPAGNYTSYMIKFSSHAKKRSACEVRRAEKKDVAAMHDLLFAEGPKKMFYPFYDFNLPGGGYYQGLTINNYYLAFEGEELVGIAGTWDQHSIKQTRIINYSGSFKLIRPLINLYGYITNGFILPANGTTLKYLTVHSILVKNNDSLIFDSLLANINEDYKKMSFNYLLLGLDEKDSLNRSLSKFSTKRVIKGKHFLVANKENIEEDLLNSLYYLEAARI